MMVASMIGMGIAQIVQGVGTAYLEADISALLDRLEIMEKKVNLNATNFAPDILLHGLGSSH